MSSVLRSETPDHSSLAQLRRRTFRSIALASVIWAVGFGAVAHATTNTWTLIGWNNLGMHCLDRDYSVMSLLPPFNTFQAHLLDPTGHLITDPTSFNVTYQAVADPDGSINTTSIGKDNFWDYVLPLYGIPAPLDIGLFGAAMPGTNNVAQGMSFDPSMNWFITTGLPILPIDDAGKTNTYPMVRLTARNTAGQVLATSDIVLPNSDEMDCRACHSAGGTLDRNPERDYRLSILKAHDRLEGGTAMFQQALTTAGYSTNGLYATATGGTPILCAKCHLSEALPGTGINGVPALTRSMHSFHSQVTDPTNGLKLDSVSNRSACYRCHPGSTTRCLRGAMGSAVAPDGSMEMQCQSCHGSMAQVGAPNRTGWLNEPSCQNCHTGTATSNNGQIRFTSAIDPATGDLRVPVNTTFATNTNTPAAGLSLYRFSKGHGGLQCSACHGSTHAEYPSAQRNDNIQNQKIQGHSGTLAECQACHGTSTTLSPNGGPHGMHPVGQTWVSQHHDVIQSVGRASCAACHGADYRGTVLSRAKSNRVLSAGELGTKTFWAGFQIGCYTCHSGPNSDDFNPNRPAVVQSVSASTAVGVPVNVSLSATDPDGNKLTLRIVNQTSHGTVALNGTIATYFPDPSFTGTDSFTFSAWDGSTDSNLGTVTISVGSGSGSVASGSQPDASIKTSAETLYTGVSVFSTDGTGETKTASISRGQTRIFDIKVQNVGTNSDSFFIKGSPAVSGYTVVYYTGLSSGTNITSAVIAGTYKTAKLAARGTAVIRVQITATSAASAGSAQTILARCLSATSSTKIDTVKAVVTMGTVTTTAAVTSSVKDD